jgi:hypothetical protein
MRTARRRNGLCDPLLMNEISFSSPDSPPQSLRDALDSRLASLVHIMNGRSSTFSRLGVLELSAGVLSLSNASGGSVFSVPLGSIQARRQRRRLALHQFFFQVHNGDGCWHLAGAVQTRYSRQLTRALVQRHGVSERAPRPTGMSIGTYMRLIENPTTHAVVWAACWVEALGRTSAPSECR